MKNFAFYIIILIVVSLGSCTNNVEIPEYNQNSYWNAYQQSEWDSTMVANSLLGEWKWVYTRSAGFQGLDERSTRLDNISVRFSRSSVELVEHGKVIQSSLWTVVQRDGDLFGVNVDPPISQLYGRILFKNENVCFCNSYVDGFDNYFEKK